MRRYNIIYYFLFLAIIMGAFASMAQNAYGMKLIGASCFGFFLLFVHELVFTIGTYDDMSSTGKAALSIELAAMSLMALLFCFRSLLIEIPFGREGIVVSLLVLCGTTVYDSIAHVRRIPGGMKRFVLGILLYYTALLFFIVTLITGVLSPAVAVLMGPVGFVALFGFIVLIVSTRSALIGSETISLLRLTGRSRNKSGILIIGFGIMFIYFGLYQASIFPPLYSGEMPPGYLELIRRAESGKTERKKFEEFGDRYSKFIRRHRD